MFMSFVIASVGKKTLTGYVYIYQVIKTIWTCSVIKSWFVVDCVLWVNLTKKYPGHI